MKKFWQSKILWNNLIAIAALAIQSQTSYLAPVEIQAALLALSNMILRAWFSGTPIDWSQVKTGFDKLLLGKLPLLLLFIGLGLGLIIWPDAKTIAAIIDQAAAAADARFGL